MKYDAIVVGAGVAGLTAAAYLAKSGKKVVVYEQQSKVGGLVQTFDRNGVFFDGGLRSIENSGVVFPMLKQLGIDIEWEKSYTSIGIEDKVITLKDRNSLEEYERFLGGFYPESKDEIKTIVATVRKVMNWMDVLYGIDNPAFMDLKKERKFVFRTLLPWMFKFAMAIGKIKRFKEPVEDYLEKITANKSLIDIIAQHFFKATPASFALSYFSLYLDYYYPKGGTATLPMKLAEFIERHGGVIRTSVAVESYDPESRIVKTGPGEEVSYDTLIWAADMKKMYSYTLPDRLENETLKSKVMGRLAEIDDFKGGDSVFSVYLTLEENPQFFKQKASGHFFYTPKKEGLSKADPLFIDNFLNENAKVQKEELFNFLEDFCDYNTYEIAIPALRDPDMAPAGKTGMVVSLLLDYRFTKKIMEIGWLQEVTQFLERKTIQVLDQSIYPGLESKVSGCFSSSPLTIEKLTGSTEGAITGWAFTNPHMPVESSMLKIARSVDTCIDSVYGAGQWVYSPSGLPISILTGKLAADKALKQLKKLQR